MARPVSDSPSSPTSLFHPARAVQAAAVQLTLSVCDGLPFSVLTVPRRPAARRVWPFHRDTSRAPPPAVPLPPRPCSLPWSIRHGAAQRWRPGGGFPLPPLRVPAHVYGGRRPSPPHEPPRAARVPHRHGQDAVPPDRRSGVAVGCRQGGRGGTTGGPAGWHARRATAVTGGGGGGGRGWRGRGGGGGRGDWRWGRWGRRCRQWRRRRQPAVPPPPRRHPWRPRRPPHRLRVAHALAAVAGGGGAQDGPPPHPDGAARLPGAAVCAPARVHPSWGRPKRRVYVCVRVQDVLLQGPV